MQTKTKKIIVMGLFVAIALVLSYIERFIALPFNVPGMKLGLANIITLIAIYKFNKKEAFLIVVVRIFLTTLITGNGIGFFYSLAGSILSFIVMEILVTCFLKYVSEIGVSVAGAFFHNIGQLLVLYIITMRITIVISYAPIIMLSSILTGIFVGFSAKFTLKSLPKERIYI